MGIYRTGAASIAVVAGSLSDVAMRDNVSVAESFLSADVIVLVDVSGSMGACDARGGQQRYSAACAELAKLQRTLPGKIAVVAFSSAPQFVPGGVPFFIGGGTDLAAALRFVQPADGCVDYIVISDGVPDDEAEALSVASRFTSKISTCYIGPEYDTSAMEFLRHLATASRGQSVRGDATQLAESVEKLMLTGA